MSGASTVDADRAWPTLRRTFLATFGLAGIAVAQPIFDITSRRPTFLASHGIAGATQVAFTIALILVPALICTSVVAACAVISRRAAVVCEGVIVGAFVAVLLAFPVAGAITRSVLAALALVLVVTFAGAAGYLRSPLLRRYARWLAIAPILLACWFLLFSPTRVVGASSEETVGRTGGRAPPSVVHVVLDEFSLGSLLTRDGDLDRERYPNVARLADISTWYRGASTNANATRIALPSILTGRFPQIRALPPTEAAHPSNIFTMLDPTHELEVTESVTALCSVRRCGSTVPFGGVDHVAADTATVYLHKVAPPAFDRFLPFLPEREWAGFFANPLLIPHRVDAVPGPLKPVARWIFTRLADVEAHPYSTEVRRFDTFVGSIRRPTDPTAWFHHALLPHHPWHLSHAVQPFDHQTVNGWSGGAFASRTDAEEALQLYLLQAKATDVLIGDLLDRLEDQDLLDEAIVVVHSDHGLSFGHGKYFRSITRARDEVLPVPLFIHYPGQRKGRIDRTNVETVDIVPTILDAVGVAARDVDGVSLASPNRRSHKRAWDGSDPPRALRPFDDRFDLEATARRIEGLFGRPGGPDDIYAWGPHRMLVGERVSRPCRTRPTIDDAGRFANVDLDGPYLPIRVSGTFTGVKTGWIALVVNGKVAGLGRPHGSGRFAIVGAPRYFQDGRNSVTAVAVDDDHDLRCGS